MATIMVVEDEPAIRELLAELLHDEGHEVLAAADGVAALALLARGVPDLVLTDAMMPGLDGPMLARWLREDSRTAAVPVVLMSAVLEVVPDGLDGVAFLAKPFDLARLLGAVAAALDGADRPGTGPPLGDIHAGGGVPRTAR